ncbi:aquaporin [Actinomycetospora sp. NBRC 106375]|uniref:MIP/aquaporin family protein n=1 Tax=Actinomycetospora sp. NBRC 106375 TaxID=3032207 RepID=UPI0024A224B0|nr:MIP/aquaporin family protein [Actinomycetospora sp. NBRC 106375]GLZ46101.1 aquaporin [Actinomycetospora sp. NBRC 106375]
MTRPAAVSPLTRELVGEFAGTFILIIFGTASVAQMVVSGGDAGDWATLTWGWVAGLIMGIYVAGRLGAGHLNPAVTIAMAVYRNLPWRSVLPYIAAQFLGAFLAALVTRGVYASGIAEVDPGLTSQSQTIFSTLPTHGIGTAFFDQIVGTALLVFVLFALIATLQGAAGQLLPLMVGFLLLGIGFAWGTNAGYAINPARDFGPRLAQWLTGYDGAWGTADGTPYWWLPIVAPIIGAVIGGGLYVLLIERLEVPAALDTPAPAPTPESAEAGANADPRHPVTAADVAVPSVTTEKEAR